MSTPEILSKIETLREYEKLAAEAAEIVESIKDEIKRHMDDLGIEQMQAGTAIIRYTNVSSSRFDTKRFKAELGEDVYKRFTKEIISRRFTISA